MIGLRFWTAPVYMKYSLKINSCVTVLCFIPIFFADHLDIVLMGALCWMMNIYVFWYHIDPPQEAYGRYHRRRNIDPDDLARKERNIALSVDAADIQALTAGFAPFNFMSNYQ